MAKRNDETDAEKKNRTKHLGRQIDEHLDEEAAKPHPDQDTPGAEKIK